MTDETSPTGDRIPATIGRYQITGVLGFGAMGAVYKAFDPLIKRTLAIKTIRLDIPESSSQHRAFIERFYQEARISGTLSHPNIVTLFDIGEEGGRPFLAMEFIDGRTIGSYIEEGVRFKPEKVIALVSQVAAALDYAHSRGVVHRDIKPSNLMLFDKDRVKVTDFGIAKLVDADITHAGALIGTPSYMSPEQALGEKLDGRSDIFSLGVCAFEMLSGLQPFPGANVTSILYKLVHVDPVEPVDLESNGLVPDKWRVVFQKVLAKKPANRYALASDFVRDLEYCLGSWFTGLGADLGAGAVAEDAPLTIRMNAAQVELVAPAGDAGPQRTVPAPAARAGALTTPRTNPSAVPAWPVPPLPGEAAPPRAGQTLPPGLPVPPLPSVVADEDAVTVLLRSSTPAPPTGSGAWPATASRVATPPVLPAPKAEEDVPATVLMAVPQVGADAPSPQAFPPPLPVAVPALQSPADAVPPRAARGIHPLVWLVGGGALLVFLMAAVVGVVFWRGSQVQPVVAESPAPLPVVPTTLPQPEPSAPVDTQPTVVLGSLRIESDPSGARVRVNGEQRGQTPLDVADLPYGDYEVRLDLKGYLSATRRTSLTEGAPAGRVRASLKKAPPPMGTVEIVSTPPGAAVSIDGQPSGTTPVSAVSLTPGAHTVRLTLEGHEPWSGELRVVAGWSGRMEASLRALPKAPPTPEPIDPTRIYADGEVDVKPRKLSGDGPSSRPKLKSGQRISVTVAFVVSSSGELRDLVLAESSGNKDVDDAVVTAVRSWKYSPATKRGVKVNCRTAFRQTFLGG